MSKLVVLGFDGLCTADEVLNRVRPLQVEHLAGLEDICVVERETYGDVYIKQAVNLTAHGPASGCISGAFWGTLIGLLFLNPHAGMAAGEAEGIRPDLLLDYGICDVFARTLREAVPQGSSALFILCRNISEHTIMRQAEPYGPRVLRTYLSLEAEERL